MNEVGGVIALLTGNVMLSSYLVYRVNRLTKELEEPCKGRMTEEEIKILHTRLSRLQELLNYHKS